MSGLGAAVVFCTTYALILPAITMEGELICEITEHFHSEECYEQSPVAAMECGLPEDATVLHSHDGNCYDNDVLICTLKEPHTATAKNAAGRRATPSVRSPKKIMRTPTNATQKSRNATERKESSTSIRIPAMTAKRSSVKSRS